MNNLIVWQVFGNQRLYRWWLTLLLIISWSMGRKLETPKQVLENVIMQSLTYCFVLFHSITLSIISFNPLVYRDLYLASCVIWVIKMRIYHENFSFVTGNSYSCAHDTSLNIRLSWDRLTFIMVKNHLHIKMPLGSSAAMMFLFLVVPNIWQWMSFKLSFEIMLKKIAIYICHPFFGTVVCDIWYAEEMWSIWHEICI